MKESELRELEAVIEGLLALYNPWWKEPEGRWKEILPRFERPMVKRLATDINEIPMALSLTGPRRVGKTTAIKQIVAGLIRERRFPPDRLLYLSMDDPQIFGSSQMQGAVLDLLVERAKRAGGGHILFLDEIQRLPMWELHIKKHYDLGAPVRFVVSGSASSPIFRASQESLAGRIQDRRMLSFNFREYSLLKLAEAGEPLGSLEEQWRLKPLLLGGDGNGALRLLDALSVSLRGREDQLSGLLSEYCREGGFLEVWPLADPARKVEYLVDQQVRKVLYEDLMSLTPYRKPENVLRFFIYLISHPGAEVNTTKVASEAGVEKRVVEENIPALLRTDLVLRINRFSAAPLRARQGNAKYYATDLALRNAVLKSWERPVGPAEMGYYAESLTARSLSVWPEASEVSFYRQKEVEVDFVVTHSGSRHLPFEVKYRRTHETAAGLRHFVKKYDSHLGVLLTNGGEARLEGNILHIPLWQFLLME